MRRSSYIFAAVFALSHLAIVAPFVPLANILPAGFGALSMTSMALCLILAARWAIVDRVMGGPDKSYGAHRWLGFFAVAGALSHWALASSVGAGVLPILSESGESVGTIAAVGLILLTVAAMVRAIPYHLWKASHMLMGPIFLLAAYHTFFVASPLAVGALPWTLMAIVTCVGLLAWAQTLRRKRSPSRLVTVQHVAPFEGGVDVTFAADKPLPRFEPGQFATLSRNRARAEAHPFSIAGGNATSRRFVIRASGDGTRELVRTLAQGDQMRISKPVGRFRPQVTPKRTPQLWVAGGVGIAPFLAALDTMEPDIAAPIHLVYCISNEASAPALADIRRHADRLPQLRLTLASSEAGARLNFFDFIQIVQDLPQGTEAYVCGAKGLKDLVQRAWRTLGRSERFHTEDADFRGAMGFSDVVQVGTTALNSPGYLWRAYAASGS